MSAIYCTVTSFPAFSSESKHCTNTTFVGLLMYLCFILMFPSYDKPFPWQRLNFEFQTKQKSYIVVCKGLVPSYWWCSKLKLMSRIALSSIDKIITCTDSHQLTKLLTKRSISISAKVCLYYTITEWFIRTTMLRLMNTIDNLVATNYIVKTR